MRFNDSRKWGQWSYLDLLERNDVQFSFDGNELKFPNKEAEDKASSIWHDLTGEKSIGVVA